MKNQYDITKAQVLKALNFLKTIPARKWIKREQTLNFDPKNIGKFHCAIGHLVVNPTSPFYKKNHVSFSGACANVKDNDKVFGIRLHRLCCAITGRYLGDVNNDPKLIGQKTPRAASLKLLKQVYKEM